MSGWAEVKVSHITCVDNLRKLRNLIPGAAAQILKEHAAMTLRTAIKLDDKFAIAGFRSEVSKPKPGEEGIVKKGTTAKAAREAAVFRSIKRTMEPIRVSDFTRSAHMQKAFGQAAQANDFKTLDALLKKFKVNPRKDPRGVVFSSLHHRANIVRSGGQARKTGFYIPNTQQIARLMEYVKRTQQNVGFKFGGFMPAFDALGVTKVAKYISRHRGKAPGSVALNLDGSTQSITVTNSASYDRKLRDRLRDALKLRGVVMGRQIKRIIKGEATNLGFATYDAGKLYTAEEWKRTQESREALKAPVGE